MQQTYSNQAQGEGNNIGHLGWTVEASLQTGILEKKGEKKNKNMVHVETLAY